MDKAANNVGFVCKALYCQMLREELAAENGAYEETEEKESDLIEAHNAYLKRLHLVGLAKLPFLYWLPKFHKTPPGARFIAAAKSCTLTKLSRAMNACCGLVLDTLREKDNETICTSGVRRFFIVRAFQEVSEFFRRWRRKGDPNSSSGLYTGDFSTMYTTIPHEDLFHVLEEVTREAFSWAGDKMMEGRQPCIQWLGGSSCSWVRGRPCHTRTTHTFSLEQLNELLVFLISNTYLKIGDNIHRQTIGIPMGTNCAPPVANLYLYYYESKYVSKVEREGGVAVARTFLNTFRLIDDVLSLDNPYLVSAVEKTYEEGGIYPEALKLEQTSTSNTAVNFLGMHVRTRKTRVITSVYDKRKDFPFVVRRYPITKSLIPEYIPYGVLPGQLHRGYEICTFAEDFTPFAVGVATILRDNGCKSGKLRKRFKSFVTNQVRRYPRRGDIIKQFNRELGNR
jgi:hypothetical protein